MIGPVPVPPRGGVGDAAALGGGGKKERVRVLDHPKKIVGSPAVWRSQRWCRP